MRRAQSARGGGLKKYSMPSKHRIIRDEPPFPSPGPVGAFRRVQGSQHRNPGGVIKVVSPINWDHRAKGGVIENTCWPKQSGYSSDYC